MYSRGLDSRRTNDNSKEIFDLLERLCISVAGSSASHEKLLRDATNYISNCPSALGSAMSHEERSMVSKIADHLNGSSNGAATKSTTSQFRFTRIPNRDESENTKSSFIFSNLYEQLKENLLNTRQRSSYISLLYHLADSKYEVNSTDVSNSNTARYSDQKHQNPKGLNSKQGSGSLDVLFSRSVSTAAHSHQSIRSQKLHKSQSQNSALSHELPTHNIAEFPTQHHHQDAGIIHSRRNNPSVMYQSSSESMANQYNIVRTNAPHEDTTSMSSNGSQNSRLNNFNALERLYGRYQELLQCVIYSFTGITTKFLKKDVITGKFKLDTHARSINLSQATIIHRLSQLGYYHDIVQAYADPASGLSAIGLMGQGFVSALRHEMTKYYGMVAMLQEQFNIQYGNKGYQTYGDNSPKPEERLTLLKILVWSSEPLNRLKWLSNIAKACVELKGGALASKVHSFLGNGDSTVKAIAKVLLLATCRPLYCMLQRWLLEGEFHDPFGEFFVECLSEVGPDRLWHEKYRVRTAMLPRFIPYEFAQKMLVAGKSINFLCEVCGDRNSVRRREELNQYIKRNAEDIFAPVPDTKLHTSIESIYLSTSKRVLDKVMGVHKLLEHLQAMRRYLLLGQGDFIGILMETLQFELDKPAKDLYAYDLSALMDVAVRSTNVQFDDPEILNHLDVRLLTPCDGDIGWDIVSLQYTVSGPLATMLEPSMSIYQLLFKPLWRMKHMEFVLVSKIWKEQKCNAKLMRPIDHEISSMLYRLYLFTSEMIHFINQMQYYILFEIIECSCAEMHERIKDAKTLDDVINAHEDFLVAVKRGAFLDSDSGELSQNLEAVYEGISRLEVWQNKFYELCFNELKERKDYNNAIKESEKTGQFGITMEQQLDRDQNQKIFTQTLSTHHNSLNNISVDYDKAVRSFLHALNANSDLNLQLFGVRLDFNEYYKKRDTSIGHMTFEQLRTSTVFYNSSMNRSIR